MQALFVMKSKAQNTCLDMSFLSIHLSIGTWLPDIVMASLFELATSKILLISQFAFE